jgi:hypothetical protein
MKPFKMLIAVEKEFIDICKMIIRENKGIKEWSLYESDDMFQSEHFCGGFDATENAFCFSYYDDNKNEYWFQISLEEARKITQGQLSVINAREAE